MLEVILAGYNVDVEVLEKLKKEGWDGKNNVTPETISAAYARISRDPRAVTELRTDAREEVDKARKSNENIVFKMGHHSVAEHAMLNFDILGLSRLAVESLQEARLCGYTEKSQRYITLEGDYVVPEELNKESVKLFKDAVAKQVDAYKKAFPILHEYQKKKNPSMLESKRDLNTIEGWAKEDARYMLALATECQLGFSSNARNLEHIIRKLKYSPLAEVRALGKLLYDKAKDVVPSLIILSDPEAFKKQFGWDVSDGLLATGQEKLESAASEFMKDTAPEKSADDINLIYHTEDPDTKVIASLLASASGKPYNQCLKASEDMKKEGKQKDFVKKVLNGLSEHDSLYRGFETVNFVFDIALSSSAFAQMKRHRMMTIIKQPYDKVMGYTIPPSIKETGQEGLFKEIMELSEETFVKFGKNSPEAAAYILANAHKRRIIVNVNLREMYHIARLRMDKHAQWDIQQVSGSMLKAVQKIAPLTAALAGGKHNYKEIYKSFFG